MKSTVVVVVGSSTTRIQWGLRFGGRGSEKVIGAAPPPFPSPYPACQRGFKKQLEKVPLFGASSSRSVSQSVVARLVGPSFLLFPSAEREGREREREREKREREREKEEEEERSGFQGQQKKSLFPIYREEVFYSSVYELCRGRLCFATTKCSRQAAPDERERGEEEEEEEEEEEKEEERGGWPQSCFQPFIFFFVCGCLFVCLFVVLP